MSNTVAGLPSFKNFMFIISGLFALEIDVLRICCLRTRVRRSHAWEHQIETCANAMTQLYMISVILT